MTTILTSALQEIQFCPPVASTEFYDLLLQFGINLLILGDSFQSHVLQLEPQTRVHVCPVDNRSNCFMICALLRWVQLGLGLVLGLFAIFAIIRSEPSMSGEGNGLSVHGSGDFCSECTASMTTACSGSCSPM